MGSTDLKKAVFSAIGGSISICCCNYASSRSINKLKISGDAAHLADPHKNWYFLRKIAINHHPEPYLLEHVLDYKQYVVEYP